MDTRQKISDLKKRLAGIQPLEDEPDFLSSDDTLARYLKSRDWNVSDAEKMLIESVEYRRKVRPLHLDCKWCHERPGCHSMRQIGFDDFGRPVVYSNFAQATIRHNTTEDTVCHCTYLIENAKRTMKPGVTTWVFVIDCTGMTIHSCNPKLGYGVSQVMSNHYPEHLGLVIIVNHNPVFNGIWKAMKVFIHPNTVSKVRLIKSKSNIKQTFQDFFSTELSDWLTEEIKLNRSRPLITSQREFWNKPPKGVAHDPRGCPSYVTNYIETIRKSDCCKNAYKPHPNIVDAMLGKVKPVSVTNSKDEKKQQASASFDNGTSDSEEEFEHIEVIDIPDEFKIPEGAIKYT